MTVHPWKIYCPSYCGKMKAGYKPVRVIFWALLQRVAPVLTSTLNVYLGFSHFPTFLARYYELSCSLFSLSSGGGGGGVA